MVAPHLKKGRGWRTSFDIEEIVSYLEGKIADGEYESCDIECEFYSEYMKHGVLSLDDIRFVAVIKQLNREMVDMYG